MTTLREVMSRDPATIEPDSTVAEAAARMVRGRFGSVLVGTSEVVVGIFTERDVLRAAGTDGDLLSTRVRDWMTPDPTTAPADQDVAEAVEEMLASGFRHLPVTDGGDIVGIVSLRDLLNPKPARSTPRPAAPEPTATGQEPDPTPQATPTPVHDRRERMFETTRLLQRHSRPTDGDADQWRRELRDAVDLVDEVVAEHIAGTEQGGGFFDELVRESGGRLQNAVKRLHRDHERSTELIGELREALDGDADPGGLRQLSDELFAQLEAHRHRGADLLWQAYGVEIGGGD